MATTAEPDDPGIIDLGGVPEVFIDGLAHYSETDGIVTSAFFTYEPVISDDPMAPGERVRVLSLKIRCTVAVQRQMRAQVLALVGDAPKALGIVAALLN